MPLSSYTPERRPIKFKTVEFSVRGLNTEDMTQIMSRRLGEVQHAVEIFLKARTSTLTQVGLDAFLIRLAADFPWIVAEIISVATDEVDPPKTEADPEPLSVLERARRLPLPVQLSALSEIMSLTFEEAGGLKNWFATQIAVLRAILPPEALTALESLKVSNAAAPSSGSTGRSEEKSSS